jgi:hypothetical protein
MSMGAPSLEAYYEFRIIENYETGKFELQKKKFIGWKTLEIGTDFHALRKQAEKYRRGYTTIVEFN